jgi:hypothetical protein
MMGTVSYSETSFNIYQTVWCYIPKRQPSSDGMMNGQEATTFKEVGMTHWKVFIKVFV